MDTTTNIGNVTIKFYVLYRPVLINKMALEIHYPLMNGLITWRI